MKGLTFKEGQPIFITQDMQYMVDSLESAIKERIYEILKPGVIPQSQLGTETKPFEITIKDFANYPFKITIGTGIAYSKNYNGINFSPDLSYLSDSRNIGGERIVIKEPVEFNLIPYNQEHYYIFISYKQSIDQSVVRVNKIDPTDLIKPYKIDSYEIYSFNSLNDPNIKPWYIFIGEISYNYSGGYPISYLIIQDGMEIAEFRSSERLSIERHLSNEHSNGIIGIDSLDLSIFSNKIKIKQLVQNSYIILNGKIFYRIAEDTNPQDNYIYYQDTAPIQTGNKLLYLANINNACKIVLSQSPISDNNYLLIGQVIYSNWNPISISENPKAYKTIDTNNLKYQSVTEEKIADNSISTSKLKNGSVIVQKLNFDDNVNLNNKVLYNVNSIGILNNNPQYPLHVSGNAAITQDLILSNNNSNLNIYYANNNGPYIRYNKTNSRWEISDVGGVDKGIPVDYRKKSIYWKVIKASMNGLKQGASGNFHSVTLFSLQPNEIIHAVKIKHNTQFTSQGQSVYIAIGSYSVPEEVTYYFDVSTPVSDSNFMLVNQLFSPGIVYNVCCNIKTEGGVSNINDGLIYFWFLISSLPDPEVDADIVIT